MMHLETISLQIPDGWAVLFNRLILPSITEVADSMLREYYFQEDLLWLAQVELQDKEWKVNPDGYHLMAGWYPEYDPEGRYVFEIQKGPDQSVLLFETQDIQLLKGKIESAIRLIYGGTETSLLKQLILTPLN